jgi:CheY-like chemotaxis protein
MQSFRDVELTSSRILIVDDQEANVRLLEFILDSAGFQEYRHTTDSRQVLQLWASFQPDLILLDLQMPHLDGFEVMEQLANELPSHVYLFKFQLLGTTVLMKHHRPHRDLHIQVKDAL